MEPLWIVFKVLSQGHNDTKEANKKKAKRIVADFRGVSTATSVQRSVRMRSQSQ